MGIGDYIIIGLIIIWLVLVLINMHKKRKQGGCSCCSQRDNCIYRQSGDGCTEQKQR